MAQLKSTVIDGSLAVRQEITSTGAIVSSEGLFVDKITPNGTTGLDIDTQGSRVTVGSSLKIMHEDTNTNYYLTLTQAGIGSSGPISTIESDGTLALNAGHINTVTGTGYSPLELRATSLDIDVTSISATMPCRYQSLVGTNNELLKVGPSSSHLSSYGSVSLGAYSFAGERNEGSILALTSSNPGGGVPGFNIMAKSSNNDTQTYINTNITSSDNSIEMAAERITSDEKSYISIDPYNIKLNGNGSMLSINNDSITLGYTGSLMPYLHIEPQDQSSQISLRVIENSSLKGLYIGNAGLTIDSSKFYISSKAIEYENNIVFMSRTGRNTDYQGTSIDTPIVLSSSFITREDFKATGVYNNVSLIAGYSLLMGRAVYSYAKKNMLSQSRLVDSSGYSRGFAMLARDKTLKQVNSTSYELNSVKGALVPCSTYYSTITSGTDTYVTNHFYKLIVPTTGCYISSIVCNGESVYSDSSNSRPIILELVVRYNGGEGASTTSSTSTKTINTSNVYYQVKVYALGYSATTKFKTDLKSTIYNTYLDFAYKDSFITIKADQHTSYRPTNASSNMGQQSSIGFIVYNIPNA